MKTLSIPIIFSLIIGGQMHARAQCAPSTAASTLITNNVKAYVNSSADLWWNFTAGEYEVPRGSGRSTTFSAGLWLAAKQNGQIRTAITRYRTNGVDFWPGPIATNGQALNCNDFDRIWKVTKQEIEDFKQDNQQMAGSIRNWPAKNNPNMSSVSGLDLAPFVDVDKDGSYDPSKGDYPAIKGDEALFWVFNDAGNTHGESNTAALGVEVHVLAYAYKTNGPTNNATFYDYTIVNKGSAALDEMYIGLYTDFDLGNPGDDFVGCDIANQMGYVYNGDSIDDGIAGYGANPPVAAIKMIEPVTMNGKTYAMSSFKGLTTAKTDEPSNANEFFYFLQGKNIFGMLDTTLDGTPTKFMFADEPGKGKENECTRSAAAGERRILMNFELPELKEKEKVTFTFANVYARSSTPGYGVCKNGTGLLKAAVKAVQKFYDEDQAVSVGIAGDRYKEERLRVYPNPTTSVLTVEGLSDINQLMIFNAIGTELLKVEQPQKTEQLSVNDFPAGVYYLQTRNADSRITTLKWIKQ